jgi:TRAP-type C4-dicarboxylate transport system permease small subunit
MDSKLLGDLENFFNRINHGIARISSISIIIIMGVMTLVLGVQIFSRYVLNSSLFWSEEFARYCFIWVIFLGATVAFQKGQHICISSIMDLFHGNTRLLLDLLIQIVLLFFIVFLIRYGFSLSLNNLIWKDISPAMQVPMWCVSSIIFLAGLALLIQVLQNGIKITKDLLFPSGPLMDKGDS